MTPTQQAAYEHFRAAMDALFDSLLNGEAEPVPPTTPVAATPPPAPVRVRTPAPAPRPSVILPRPVVPPSKPGTVLTDAQRKAHLPAAKAVALKILKVIGDNAQLVPGVTGQLALERIPFDPTLVTLAIDAARREL